MMISSCFGGPKGRRFWPQLLKELGCSCLLLSLSLEQDEEVRRSRGDAQNSQQSDRGEEALTHLKHLFCKYYFTLVVKKVFQFLITFQQKYLAFVVFKCLKIVCSLHCFIYISRMFTEHVNSKQVLLLPTCLMQTMKPSMVSYCDLQFLQIIQDLHKSD